MEDKEKLIIVAGPTASGKSAAAVRLAKDLNGSCISADSMQVYRHMDIGTAKITEEEMQGIPHFLIDICSPKDEWNAVLFRQKAKDAIRQIRKEGRLPILVGGTGFYIQALLYDIDFTPMKEDPGLREKLREYAEKNGAEALHRKLAAADPESAKAIPAGNVKRVIRALEYYQGTGEKISDHNKKERQKPPAYDAVFFVLTMNREELYRRIDARVDRMMEEGLLREVMELKKMGCTRDLVSMQGLGYKQLLSFLDGECSLDEAVAQIKLQTRHFSKRQLTWFRREKNVIWVDKDAFAGQDEMIRFMEEKIRENLGEEIC